MKTLPIYLHIPRTAGTSLQHYAEAVLDELQILAIYGSDIERAGQVAFQALSVQPYRPYQLVRGHFAFGIHKHIARPTTYFTVVRHPVDRVVSLYNYIRGSKAHTFHQAVSSMILSEFITSEVSTEVDNGQVRQLSGCCGEFPQKPYQRAKVPYGKCTYDLLDQALYNLRDHFDFVLPMERVSSLPHWCHEFFGWPEQALGHRNASKGIQTRQLTVEQQELILEHNELDQILYSYVVSVLGGIL